MVDIQLAYNMSVDSVQKSKSVCTTLAHGLKPKLHKHHHELHCVRGKCL